MNLLGRTSLLAILGVLVFGIVSSAPPAIPYTLSGELIIDGSLAPVRTVVEARNSEEIFLGRFVTVKEGRYGLFSVEGDDPETEAKEGSSSQERIYLWVNGFNSGQSFIWESGGFNYGFDLNIITRECIDCDGDGYSNDDCDDNNSAIHPFAEEICDNLDNNCDGEIDSSTRNCGSGIGECSQGVELCSNGQWQGCIGFDGPNHEICDGLDNDCDGSSDEGLSCSTEGSYKETTPTDILRQDFPEPVIQRDNETGNGSLNETNIEEDNLEESEKVKKVEEIEEDQEEEIPQGSNGTSFWDQVWSSIALIFEQLKSQEIVGNVPLEINSTDESVEEVPEEAEVREPISPQIENQEFESCVTEWACTSWTPCIEGFRSSTCIDWNNCHPDYSDLEEMILEENCQVPTVERGVDPAIQGQLTSNPTNGILLVVGIAVVLFVFFKWVRWW